MGSWRSFGVLLLAAALAFDPALAAAQSLPVLAGMPSADPAVCLTVNGATAQASAKGAPSSVVDDEHGQDHRPHARCHHLTPVPPGAVTNGWALADICSRNVPLSATADGFRTRSIEPPFRPPRAA